MGIEYVSNLKARSIGEVPRQAAAFRDKVFPSLQKLRADGWTDQVCVQNNTVVTDPKKANLALRWAVDEMERRYDLLARMGVRDIASYNKKLVKVLARSEAKKLREAADEVEREVQDEFAWEGEKPEEKIEEELDLDEPPRKLPWIVVVIDEFADLMMCAPKEVEHSVTRIAQKARACGIHLLLATQRPTTEVITGLIKSNFPSRIAFRVTNKVNSIAILEQSGAEALLGQGDMLFNDRGMGIKRVHGCLVQDEEIQSLVEFMKQQGKPVYNMEILAARDEAAHRALGFAGVLVMLRPDPAHLTFVTLMPVAAERMVTMARVTQPRMRQFTSSPRYTARNPRRNAAGLPAYRSSANSTSVMTPARRHSRA